MSLPTVKAILFVRISASRLQEELILRESEEMTGNFRLFLEGAWDIVEPGAKFMGGYHIDAIAEHLQACAEGQISKLVINVPPRTGKALAHETPVLTPDGWRTHGDLQPGDFVYGLEGKPVRVLAVSDDVQIEHEVRFTNGARIKAHARHEWQVFARSDQATRIVDTAWLSEHRLLSGTDKPRCTYQLPKFQPLCGTYRGDLPLHPYFLGVWLGDGTTTSAAFCFAEKDRVVADTLAEIGFTPSWTTVHRTTGVNYQGWRGVRVKLRSLGVLGDKHIPSMYLQASIEQRLQLLAGLIDTDGTVTRTGRVAITTCDTKLRDGIIELVRSMGWFAGVTGSPPKTSSSGVVGRRTVWRVAFQPDFDIPTRVPRKKITRLATRRAVGFVGTEACSPVPGRCIQVDSPDGLYLVGKELIPTHNSTICSVLYPAWLWTRDPSERMLFASYALELSRRDSTRNRRVVKTKWFAERWPFVVLSDDHDTRTVFENTATGIRQAVSVGSTTTGLGGTHLVLDDPHSAQQAESAVYRATTLDWFREAWSTRLNPGRGVQIVIMQRLHQGDVSGYCLQEGGWEHLCLPMEYEGSKHFTSIGWRDPRTEPGEILWKERFGTDRGLKELAALKKTLGSVGVAGQLQQRPVPRGGSTFKAGWLRFWYDPDLGEPDPVIYVGANNTPAENPQKPLPPLEPSTFVSSWDLAFKGGVLNDYVVGQTWASGLKDDRANRYLIAQERGQYDFVETIQAIRRLNDRHPPAVTLIEEKANGAAVITSLKTEMPAVVAINPEGGKESRASGVAPMFEAGNIWLPHPKQFPWAQAYIDELLSFPKANHDDQVDATTQALLRMKSKRVEEIDMAPSIGAAARWSPWRI